MVKITGERNKSLREQNDPRRLVEQIPVMPPQPRPSVPLSRQQAVVQPPQPRAPTPQPRAPLSPPVRSPAPPQPQKKGKRRGSSSPRQTRAHRAVREKDAQLNFRVPQRLADLVRSHADRTGQAVNALGNAALAHYVGG